MAQHAQTTAAPKEKAVLYYDPDCGFCTKTGHALEKLTFGKIRSEPYTSPEADKVLAGVKPEERYDRAWMKIDDRILGGYEAMWNSLYLLPFGFILKPLRYLPGFHPISDRFYRFVADHRSPQCRLNQHT